MSPYEEDLSIKLAAGRAGLTILTRPVVRVDKTKLHGSYLQLTPNYRKIRHDLMQGVQIQGVELTTDVEYVLSKRETNDGDL